MGSFADQKTGRVKWYNKQKGYGFITKDDGTGDCYVHFSGLTKGNRARYAKDAEKNNLRDDRGWGTMAENLF